MLNSYKYYEKNLERYAEKYVISQNNKNIFYATDTPSLTENALNQLKGIKLDIVIMDHTFGDVDYSFSHLNEKLFIEQIKAGKPLTITEPKMTRFIMSLEEAVELVVFAFQNADAGDIMVQKAPACTIEVLAQAVKELKTDYRVAMTGTPVENRLTELWSIFDFINKGYLGSLKDFQKSYAIPIERFKEKTR